MRARASAAVLVLLFVVAGCGGAAPDRTTPPVEPPTPPPTAQTSASDGGEVPTAFVEARGSGETEEQAQSAALELLREGVLGADLAVSVQIHDPARDPRQVDRTGGAVTVWLGLSEERVREVLAAVEAIPAPSLAPPFATPVATLHGAALQGAVCERRRALFQEECEPPDTTSLAGQVRELATQVRLRAAHEGGVPVDEAGRPMRDGAVVVEHVQPDGSARPLPGIAVVARVERDGPPIGRTSTDEDGRAQLTLERGQPLTEPLFVAIDREAMLGPVASHWPAREVRLVARPRDIRRWTGVARERVAGRTSTDGAFVAGLQAAMRSHGSRAPMQLEDDERDRLLATTSRQRAEVFPELADTWGGRVDYVLIGDVESDFASRMGQTRVWYEAQGRLEAVDAWSGRTLATVETSVTAPGLGDERAARAAHRALAEQLVVRLMAELGASAAVASASR